ncbi:helix-turn-helix transcriptional regulator [Streptomyces sp. NPDC048290]|uniref:helix-turn-helix domain-containing protein n=1 Tax=Streptomyces sp. NPDC048290 TaxID=3155811 RepID=UPI00342C4DF0
MSDQAPRASDEARVIPLRPAAPAPVPVPTPVPVPVTTPVPRAVPRSGPSAAEPLWRDLVGDVLRRERLAQERTLKDVADEARISMPYLSEVERGRKEASSEVLAAAARALGLGLGDLLSLAQGELVRTASRTAVRRRTPSHPTGTARAPRATRSSYDGLLLAA